MQNLQQAISFAARVHRHQLRKDGVTPYIAHCMRVMMTVHHAFGCEDEVALCAAVLHDTIEDTDTDYDDIEERFGVAIADAVAALTKDMRLPNDVRETRYDETLTAASWQARLVKLADVYDNVSDSESTEMRTGAVAKARRAILCAGKTPELQTAIARLRQILPDERI